MTESGTDPSAHRAEPPPRRGPAFFILYYGVAGAAALYLAAARPAADLNWVALAVVWFLMVGSDYLPAWLPRGGYSTPGSAVDFAALLLFGPQTTAWMVVSSALVSQLALLRRPLERAVYNAALFTLMAATSGHVFTALGGQPGSLVLPRDLVAVGAAAVAYFLVNALGVSLVLGFTQRLSVVRILQGNYLSAAFQHLSNLAVGATAALMFVSVGLWGLLIFLLPLLASGLGFRRYFEMKRDLLEFVRALAQVLEEVDPYTREHSIRVAEYSKQVARELRVPEREIDDIEFGALLHDLGKIGRQYQAILQKPGALTFEERQAIHAHPDRGADIVARVRALTRAAEYVRCHHERLDGAGYPRGLTAGQLPLGARIIIVCDSFDAMTSDRSYRRALTVEEALDELRRCAGTQFDPVVVAALERLLLSGRAPLLYPPEAPAPAVGLEIVRRVR